MREVATRAAGAPAVDHPPGAYAVEMPENRLAAAGAPLNVSGPRVRGGGLRRRLGRVLGFDLYERVTSG